MHSFGIKYVKKMLAYFNVFVIIWLLVTYVLLFGLSSVEKYIEKDVNIINQEENPTTILPPGEILSFITCIVCLQVSRRKKNEIWLEDQTQFSLLITHWHK